MIDRKAARAAAAAAKKEAPVAEDRALAALRRARVGRPALVRTPAGEPAFWLAPFVSGDLACGLAHVDLDGRVARIGAFGAGPADRQSWVPLSFFEEAPAGPLAEIRAAYPGLDLSEPVLSYDASPARWAWRVEATGRRGVEAVAFIGPGGWYEVRPGQAAGELEG